MGVIPIPPPTPGLRPYLGCIHGSKQRVLCQLTTDQRPVLARLLPELVKVAKALALPRGIARQVVEVLRLDFLRA